MGGGGPADAGDGQGVEGAAPERGACGIGVSGAEGARAEIGGVLMMWLSLDFVTEIVAASGSFDCVAHAGRELLRSG